MDKSNDWYSEPIIVIDNTQERGMIQKSKSVARQNKKVDLQDR